MNIKNVCAGIMTKDIKAAFEWYGKLFGRKSDYHPMENVHEWNFPDGGVLQLVADKERAGHSSITLMIKNRDEQMKKLTEMNVSLGRKTESETAKTVTITDPEGNRITFAEKVEGK